MRGTDHSVLKCRGELVWVRMAELRISHLGGGDEGELDRVLDLQTIEGNNQARWTANLTGNLAWMTI